MVTVEIYDEDPKGYLGPSLVDVLEVIKDIGVGLRWSVLGIDGILSRCQDQSRPSFEQEVYCEPTGLVLNWENLLLFANKFLQITDGWFVGTTSGTQLPRRDQAKNDLLTSSRIFVEAFDATLWIVNLADESLAPRFAKRFHDVKIVGAL